jgi:ElaB/YqjD/DUF883 family membrane-anchored ribosome-binding protein
MAKEKTKEALDTLAEAAREKQVELQDLIRERSGANRTPLQRWMMNQGTAIRNTATRAGTAVDSTVRKSPWPFIGGAAATGVILGVLLGRGGNGRNAETTERK